MLAWIRIWVYNTFISNKRKADKVDLIAELIALGKTVQWTWPDINRGGCCVFAALVADELRKKGIQVEGFVAAVRLGPTRSVDEARSKIKSNTAEEWQNNGIYLNHVGLEFWVGARKVHYDTSTVKDADRTFDGMDIYKGRLRPEELKVMARSHKGWNTMFNRKDIPAIRKYIRQFFKDINVSPAALA